MPAYVRGQLFGASQVYQNAIIEGDAKVHGRAHVYGHATVKGEVLQAAQVYGNALVEPTGIIFSNSIIRGTAVITGEVYGGEISE